MRWILAFFIAVPLLEMLLLFEVADLIGGLWTILLVILTAVIGVQILRQQGFSTLLRANQRMQEGALPAQEIVEGLLLACAGALLLTPGFITDTLGFLCLTPPVRRLVASKILSSGWFVMGGSGGGSVFFRSSRGEYTRSGRTTTIEGEFTEESGTLRRSADVDRGPGDP